MLAVHRMPLFFCATLSILVILPTACAPSPDARSMAVANEDVALHVRETPMATLPGLGLAGGYGGVSNGTLIFAGGTNFPDGPPWTGGKKRWHDEIYTLAADGDDAQWTVSGRLPYPLAGGSAVTTPRGVVVIGGTDDTRVVADVLLLTATGAGVSVTKLPSLPTARWACGAAVIGNTIYVVGGHPSFNPLDGDPLSDILALDLDRVAAGWKIIATVPGGGRWYPVVGADDRSLAIVSGMYRAKTTNATTGTAYGVGFHRDAWVFTPDQIASPSGSWRRLTDLPRAFAAAPSPAPVVDGKMILLGGGVTDEDIVKTMDARGPLDDGIRTIDLKTGAIAVLSQRVAMSVIATSVVRWSDDYVVISGELQAGRRTGATHRYSIGR